MNIFDLRTLSLIGAVLVLLGCAWTIVKVLKRRPESGIDPAILETFHLRVRAWWILFAVLAAAFLFGHVTTVVLFGLISFWALREFITLTPTRPGDHRTLFWVFFLFTPLQFVLVGTGYLRAVQHRDPGLRLPVRAGADRLGRRLQAVPGTDGEDSVGAADLRLLPQLCAGAVDAQAAPLGQRRAGHRRRRAAAVLLRVDRATQRRPAIRLVADPQPARDRAHDQRHPNLGRIAGRDGQRDA